MRLLARLMGIVVVWEETLKHNTSHHWAKNPSVSARRLPGPAGAGFWFHEGLLRSDHRTTQRTRRRTMHGEVALMKTHRFATYLRRRPDSQFPAFRYTVPRDIRPFWAGPKVICLSLRTADPARCRQLVADHVADCQARFQRLREIHLRPWRLLDATNASLLSAEVSSTLEQGVLENDVGVRQEELAQSPQAGSLSARRASEARQML
ncbi:hypothetical protein AWV79_07600 [Cupriavidus sp. UYMMa02A]|nr:hypothetical protein AWV79_07600 [Cupriavidus sp. UYMMa02A]